MDSDFGDQGLNEQISAASTAFSGVLACWARNLGTGDELGVRADATMPTASTIKVGIMAELYRQADDGEIDLEQRVVAGLEDYEGGTGILKELMPGIAPTVRDLCRLMIVVSDNVATKLLVKRLGRDRINGSFRQWGLAETRLVWDHDRPDARPRDYAVSTPRELGRLMTLIATDGFLTPEACAAMRDHLARQQHGEQIPRGLPHNPFAGFRGGRPETRVLNKIGCDDGVRTDVAIIDGPRGRFVLVTMNEGSPDHNYQIDHEGNVLNGRIGRILYDAWAA